MLYSQRHDVQFLPVVLVAHQGVDVLSIRVQQHHLNRWNFFQTSKGITDATPQFLEDVSTRPTDANEHRGNKSLSGHRIGSTCC